GRHPVHASSFKSFSRFRNFAEQVQPISCVPSSLLAAALGHLVAEPRLEKEICLQLNAFAIHRSQADPIHPLRVDLRISPLSGIECLEVLEETPTLEQLGQHPEVV